MKTELIVNQPKVEGGLQIEVDQYNVRNFRLHKVLETCARSLLFLIESRSNNASAVTTPQDAKTVQGLWNMIVMEWERAKKFKGGPTGTLERVYHIVRPTPSELQKISNIKVKSAALELDHLMEIIIASDSANLDVYVGAESQSNIEEEILNVGSFLKEWLGDGSGPDATGVVAPEGLRILGEVVPDVDLDTASMQEPSANVQPPRVPDAPDVSPKK